MCIRDRCTITGCCLTKIFIRNRLYGRNTFQHLIMVLTHINHIIERFRLDIKPFGKHVQFLSRVHHQLGIRQIHQFFVTVRPAITCLTDSRGNRIFLQNHPIQIIVTLQMCIRDRFMIGTGKIYGLESNSLVDERRDPIKATWAAARYLLSLIHI